MSSHPQRILNDSPNQLPVRYQTWCHFDNLLIPPLNTAFAFPQMSNISSSIANSLDFNMAESIDSGLFGENLIRRALLHGSLDCRCQRGFISDKTYAAAAATIYSFHHDGIPGFPGELEHCFRAVCWRL